MAVREHTPEELDEIYDGQREDMAVDQKVSKWMRKHGPARLSPEDLEAQIVKELVAAIYPILIPMEEQSCAIQARNYEQVEGIARQAWRSFLETRN